MVSAAEWEKLYRIAEECESDVADVTGKGHNRVVLFRVYASLVHLLGFHPSWVRKVVLAEDGYHGEPTGIVRKSNALHRDMSEEHTFFLPVAAARIDSYERPHRHAVVFGFRKYDLVGKGSYVATLNREVDFETNSVEMGPKERIYIPGDAVTIPTWLLIGGS